MSGPTGLIFSVLRYEGQYTNILQWYDSGFSGQDDEQPGRWLDKATGLGTTGQVGFPIHLCPFGSGGSNTDFNVDQGMTTVDAENLGNGTGNQFNEMAFSIEKVTITAKSRHSKQVLLELAQGMKAIHGLNAEAELAYILSLRSLLRSTESCQNYLQVCRQVLSQHGNSWSV